MISSVRKFSRAAAWLLLVLPWAGAASANPQCADALGRMPAGEPLAPEIEILSWNIQKAENPGWEADFQRLAGDVQLAFIQEASLQAGIPELLSGELVEVFAQGYATDTLDTGVMTLGAGYPSLHCAFSILEPWLGTPKASSVAEYALRDREERLLVINLHAVNFTLGVEDLELQFADLVGVLAQHRGPAILAGDLNTWSESRQQLVDDFMTSQDMQPVTFEPDLRSRPFGRALDHIFVRGLRTEYAEVIPVESSDHNPLRVRLALD
jgi:endonuclease/exonuclease/phosphatase (EEP) superfamily protein YafD